MHIYSLTEVNIGILLTFFFGGQKDPKIVVDYIEREVNTADGDTFSGANGYTMIPDRCFLDNATVLVTTLASYGRNSYVIDLGL